MRLDRCRQSSQKSDKSKRITKMTRVRLKHNWFLNRLAYLVAVSRLSHPGDVDDIVVTGVQLDGLLERGTSGCLRIVAKTPQSAVEFRKLG